MAEVDVDEAHVVFYEPINDNDGGDGGERFFCF